MSSSAQKPYVLIVDPDTSYQEFMGYLLAEKVYSDFATSTEEAIRKCYEKEYDLVITEIDLPDKKAFDLIKKIKEERKNTVIVIITNDENFDSAVRAIRLGALDIIRKPFTVEDIAIVIEKFFYLAGNKKSEYALLNTMVEEKRTFVLPTSPKLVNGFLNEFMDILKRFPGIDSKIQMSLRLSVYEMMINAMEHGNLEIDYEMKRDLLDTVPNYAAYLHERAQLPPYNSRTVKFSYHFSNKSLEISIEDEGPGFDVSKVPSPKNEENISGLNGRGIFITKLNLDQLYYNEKGNRVTLVKKLAPTA